MAFPMTLDKLEWALIYPILSLSVLLCWRFPDAFALCLLVLALGMLVGALSPFGARSILSIDTAGHLIVVWYFVFVAGSTVAVVIDVPHHFALLDGIGDVLVDGHSRLVPLLLLALLLLNSRIADRAAAQSRWCRRFLHNDVYGQRIAINADLERELIDVRARDRRHLELEQKRCRLTAADYHLHQTTEQSRLCFRASLVGLFGGTLWRVLWLDHDWSSGFFDCSIAVLSQTLVLTVCMISFSAAFGLALSAQENRGSSSGDVDQLYRREPVLKVIGGLGAELGMAWLGVPPGLSLVLYILGR